MVGVICVRMSSAATIFCRVGEWPNDVRWGLTSVGRESMAAVIMQMQILKQRFYPSTANSRKNVAAAACIVCSLAGSGFVFVCLYESSLESVWDSSSVEG